MTPGTAAAYLPRFGSVINSVCLAGRRSSKSHFLTKTAVAVKKGCWSTGAEKDEISFEAFAVNDRSGFCNSFKVVPLLGRVGGELSPRLDPKKPLPMATQRPGFFFWIPPNVTYWSWAEKVRALRYLEVQFDLEQLERILGDDLDFGRINRPSNPRHSNRVTTCASLLANACLADAENRLYGDSLVAAFLAATHKELSREAASNESGLVPWQLRLAKSYIEEHFRQDIGLAELANLAHLSQSRFARGFRIFTGVPPYSWAIRRRIEAAEHLLGPTNMPLSEIAVQVGFADQSHLTKAFRRALGATPAAWRRDQKR